jgi:GNAT superfamily N-acetyltransferase
MPLLIRPAKPEDATAIAHVHVESWRTTYPGVVPDAFLESLDKQASAKMWREQLATEASLIFVAETDGEVIGFASAGPSREAPPEYDAELYAIYVLNRAQRQGAGRALFQAVTSGLLAKGYKGMLLWALEANPHLPFYERLGGVRINTKTIEIGGTSLSEIAFGWPDHI